MAAPAPPAANLLAALAYGERLAERRATESAALATSARGRRHQEEVARREARAADLLEARLLEVGSLEMRDPFRPFFDKFFEHTAPSDWLEAQAFHYVGDAIVRDFAEALIPLLDPVSAEVVRLALSDRDEQEAFALDELTRGLDENPDAGERVAAYARRVIGEALNQTRRALTETGALRGVLADHEAEKRLILELLDRHRRRLDRLGIEIVE